MIHDKFDLRGKITKKRFEKIREEILENIDTLEFLVDLTFSGNTGGKILSRTPVRIQVTEQLPQTIESARDLAYSTFKSNIPYYSKERNSYSEQEVNNLFSIAWHLIEKEGFFYILKRLLDLKSKQELEDAKKKGLPVPREPGRTSEELAEIFGRLESLPEEEKEKLRKKEFPARDWSHLPSGSVKGKISLAEQMLDEDCEEFAYQYFFEAGRLYERSLSREFGEKGLKRMKQGKDLGDVRNKPYQEKRKHYQSEYDAIEQVHPGKYNRTQKLQAVADKYGVTVKTVSKFAK